MTKRIIRLLIAFVAFVSLFLVVRHFLVPSSFYEIGTYRADALKDIAKFDPKYADVKQCDKCHADIDSTKSHGAHSGINCQTCHGPGIKHIADAKNNKMKKPSGRDFCANCHNKNASRPAFIKQVDVATHNKKMDCIKCHKPHSPSMKPIKKTSSADSTGAATSTAAGGGVDCEMCHADKVKFKSGGVHKTVMCQSCHGTGEQHMQAPAANLMPKPTERAFCGSCHGKGIAPANSGIKQVDLKEHNTDNKCIECHNPHSPFDGM